MIERQTLLGELLRGTPLTYRERDVLSGLADGETAKETARRLHLSSETVRAYRKRVIAKLGARNGPHAVAEAFKRGIIRI